ncbi:GtrA family protein [Ochrobactrum sp. POC9]|uniref:GtrA family protein n=1 Tax=Ochrobactrum sp. POC9 TaxID=2203419 RepID=UPI000D70685C|nr:GtrA family protein [Ochrobactrum sp. POC9]PWU72333.1 GtrA family protein [Ochrobactrum sp. POC9]
MRIIQQAVKFGLVGLVNTLITLIVIAFLTWANVSPWIANAVGYAAGLINSYYGNLLWTFTAPPSNSNKLKFFTSFAIAYAINLAFLSITLPLTEIHAMVPQILSMVAYTLTFFVLSKFWVFKN